MKTITELERARNRVAKLIREQKEAEAKILLDKFKNTVAESTTEDYEPCSAPRIEKLFRDLVSIWH